MSSTDGVKADANRQISEYFRSAINAAKSVLDVAESRRILELAGIPMNKSDLAETPDSAVKIAKRIGYPVVMKIVSPQVIHKTEFGGVRVNIDSDGEVRKVFNEMVAGVHDKLPDAEISGVLIEEMVSGTEFIIGTTVDPQFGHMLMFGIGGIFVEVYKDVSFRLIPITTGDAIDMLGELKGKALLSGVRGFPKADLDKLADLLVNVSELVNKFPEIQEMDINPLMITKNGAIAVDARILLNTSSADS
jgi:acyl-CoA synthetase (NDP forming)